MSPIRELERKYCSRAMAAAILIALLTITAGYKDLGKGLVLGTLFSVLNFVLMGEMLPLRIGKTKRGTYLYSLLSVGLRYALLAVPPVIALKFDGINLFAAVFGIFMVQLVLFADHFYRLFHFHPAARTRRH